MPLREKERNTVTGRHACIPPAKQTIFENRIPLPAFHSLKGKLNWQALDKAQLFTLRSLHIVCGLLLLIYRLSSPGSRTLTHGQNIFFLSCHKLLARKPSFWFTCRCNWWRTRNTTTGCVILSINRRTHSCMLSPLSSTRHGQK